MKPRKPKKPRKLLPGEPEKWNVSLYRALYRAVTVYERGMALHTRILSDPEYTPYLSSSPPPLVPPERFAALKTLLLQDKAEHISECQALHDALYADLAPTQKEVDAVIAARMAALGLSQTPPP